jgi:phosphatidylglycerophosphate synthase
MKSRAPSLEPAGANPPRKDDSPDRVDLRSPRESRPIIKALPNCLSLLRLACAPVLVIVAAATGSRLWFWGIFGAMLLTDALDGFLARRLRAVSDLGRRLDSYGDYATVGATVASVWLLWPAVMQREWAWIAGALVACFAVTIYGLVAWRIVPGYHTLLAKALGFVLPATLALLLLEWSPIPFHLAVGLQAVAGGEELAIALLLPGYSGEVRSVWQARRRRQALRSSPPSQPEESARPPK